MKTTATLLMVSLLLGSPGNILPVLADDNMQALARANRMISQNNYPAAQKFLESILRENPNQEGAWILLGHIYRQQCTTEIVFGVTKGSESYLEKATKCFRKAIELNPRSAKGYTGLGEMYCIDDKYKQAIVLANKSLSIDPTEYRAFKVRGMSNAGLGNYKEASRDLNVWIEKDGADFRTITTKAQIDEQLGDYKSAYESYRKLLLDITSKKLLLHERDEIRLKLAFCASKIGKPKESLERLSKLIEKNPKYYNAYLQRARLYRDLKRKELARQDYQKALALKYSKPVMIEMKALK